MEPIAIIGIGCRFPSAENPDAFWKLLRDGGDAITEVPKERWDVDEFYDRELTTTGKMNTRRGGFLEQIDGFDPEFFEMSAAEAERMDPQQRLVLEVAWETLENAGVAAKKLAGSQTGVFVGIGNYDYHTLLSGDLSTLEGYSGSGTSNCIAANRLSYLLDLRGPSLAIDTACSSSLVALHLACQSLQLGESDFCLVGGVNAILSPEVTIAFSQAGMTAADGRCKTFDASADGYVRGEGCGMVAIARLGDAIENGYKILAIVRGSAVNQDGLSNGLTSPNGPSQQAVIRRALEKAGVAPADISYVETQGTGTSLGDLIEVKSLKAVLMQGRQSDQPCWIGSVKANIGHLESAAGMASLIKAVLSMQHGEIPAQVHLKELNPYISLEQTPLSIPTKRQPWLAGTPRRLAGVSAFGFGGTNCHVVLEEAPKQEAISNPVDPNDRPVHLLALSAKTEKALKELAQRYQVYLQSHSEVSLADVCFTANTGRSHFNYRLAAIAQSIPQLCQQLADFTCGKPNASVASHCLSSRKRPKIAFLFPGDGSFWGMAAELYQTQPTFRQILDRCDAILRSYLDKPLLEILYSQSPAVLLADETVYGHATLVAIEYAIAQLCQAWGIEPKAMMGYGIGEYVAACLAGVFSLEDALKLVTAEGAIAQKSSPSETCNESPTTPWGKSISEVTFSSPKIDLIAPPEIATPDYWYRRDSRSREGSVRMNALKERGCHVLLEISPTPILLDGARNLFLEGDEILLPILQKGLSNWQTVLQSLGQLYCRGVPVDWSAFDRNYSRRYLQLPTYPFQRQRYWAISKTPETRLDSPQRFEV